MLETPRPPVGRTKVNVHIVLLQVLYRIIPHSTYNHAGMISYWAIGQWAQQNPTQAGCI